MNNHLFQVFKMLRPRQWTKNVALFAAITFGGLLPISFGTPVDFEPFFRVVLGFIAFCLLSSSTYIINDIVDVKKDKLHPFKKERPIASGKVSLAEAKIIFLLLLIVAFVLAKSLSTLFFFIAVFYIALQFSYSLFLKSIVIFDILSIALGYIIRVYTGEVISGAHIPVWLLLTTISLSLFLAVGKRRSELTLLKNFHSSSLTDVRTTLTHYSETLLDAYSTMFATSTFIMYSLFTFQEDPSKPTLSLLLPDFLPSSFERKWLMITTLPVIYGLMRYMQDIYEKQEGESPEKVLLSDKPLLASIIVWVTLVIFIIYVFKVKV